MSNEWLRPEVGKTYKYVKVGQKFSNEDESVLIWSEHEAIPEGYEHWDTVYVTIYQFATVVKEDGDRYLFHVTDELDVDKQFLWYELGQDFFMSDEEDLEWYYNALYPIEDSLQQS